MDKVFTGRGQTFLASLCDDLRNASKIRIIVSFIMESGVRLLEETLQEALRNGAEIEIITGTYLGITEPSALYLLKKILGEDGRVRIFQGDTSFHPKGYFIEGPSYKRVYVGSSNISKTGLTMGLEWNYLIDGSTDLPSVLTFESHFIRLYNEETLELTEELLRSYTSAYRKKEMMKEISNKEEDQAQVVQIEPRGIQLEALYEIEKAREEGIEKGLLVSATGSGKTFISAFDAKQFDVKRLLFIAHRQEILEQSLESFRIVHSEKTMALFMGNEKDSEADFIFASIQTLSKDNYLRPEYFAPDGFDYIIVDEFHHAAAESYKRVLDYFKPAFLLGLTATPYRMDQQDILSLCDNHIFYELPLFQAINRDILSPFRYYGVYDETDYGKVERRNGAYVTESLERVYSDYAKETSVYEKYKAYGGKTTVGFCVSISHAEKMASYFRKKGVKAMAVHSQMNIESTREEIVKAFKEGHLNVVFTVDLFNEGVDIKEIDTVLFLRPTESYVVFLQQLGRGLRKFPGKKELIVIDFIGNYKNAHYKPILLAGKNPMQVRRTGKRADEFIYPEGCHVHYDLRVLDLFEEMRKRDPRPQLLKEEYHRIKNSIKRRPQRVDLYLGSDVDYKEYLKKGYLKYLGSLGELTEIESSWLGTELEVFLHRMEKTSMSRSFKIPVLMAMVQGNGKATYNEIADVFQKYYLNNRLHGKDLDQDKGNKEWRNWSEEKFLKKALDMPVHFLSKSENLFIQHDASCNVIKFSEEIIVNFDDTLKCHLQDILLLREKVYYSRRYFKVEEVENNGKG